MENLKENMPGIIAMVALVGFIGILGFSLKGGTGKENELLHNGFSTLSVIITSVVGYYYGNKSAEATQKTARSIENTMETMRKTVETNQSRTNG